jgi:mono/diheme cytochrome c family protein
VPSDSQRGSKRNAAKGEGIPGRGAQRRSALAKQRADSEARRWWSQPGVLLFFAAVLLTCVGAGLAIRSVGRIPVEETTLGGLRMRIFQTRWILDQMDHGENFQKPSTMMPGMPEWGMQRVSLDLGFWNESESGKLFDGSEFFLVPELGEQIPPSAAQIGRASIAPGQTLNTALYFDLDTTKPHGKLRVEWRRAGDVAYLAIPEPAEHYHLRPRGGELALPPDARLLLPIGKAERGANLYAQVYGCIACHGDPGVPDSNNVGPHLGRIGVEAGSRIDGKEAPQYIYEAILEPNRFIAPECKDGRPCSEPSAMPEYSSLVSLEDVADMLAYLLEQGRTPPSPSASQ